METGIVARSGQNHSEHRDSFTHQLSAIINRSSLSQSSVSPGLLEAPVKEWLWGENKEKS